MNVFICGAETLTVPALDDDGDEVQDANTARFYRVCGFLVFELTALAQAGQLTQIGYDPACQISCVLDRAADPVTTTQVAIADALASFKPDLVMAIGGGLSPDAGQQAAIEALIAQAQAAGVLVRDAANLG